MAPADSRSGARKKSTVKKCVSFETDRIATITKDIAEDKDITPPPTKDTNINRGKIVIIPTKLSPINPSEQDNGDFRSHQVIRSLSDDPFEDDLTYTQAVNIGSKYDENDNKSNDKDKDRDWNGVNDKDKDEASCSLYSRELSSNTDDDVLLTATAVKFDPSTPPILLRHDGAGSSAFINDGVESSDFIKSVPIPDKSPLFVGFATARGNAVNISWEARKIGQKLVDEVDTVAEASTSGTTETNRIGQTKTSPSHVSGSNTIIQSKTSPSIACRSTNIARTKTSPDITSRDNVVGLSRDNPGLASSDIAMCGTGTNPGTSPSTSSGTIPGRVASSTSGGFRTGNGCLIRVSAAANRRAAKLMVDPTPNDAAGDVSDVTTATTLAKPATTTSDTGGVSSTTRRSSTATVKPLTLGPVKSTFITATTTSATFKCRTINEAKLNARNRVTSKPLSTSTTTTTTTSTVSTTTTTTSLTSNAGNKHALRTARYPAGSASTSAVTTPTAPTLNAPTSAPFAGFSTAGGTSIKISSLAAAKAFKLIADIASSTTEHVDYEVERPPGSSTAAVKRPLWGGPAAVKRSLGGSTSSNFSPLVTPSKRSMSHRMARLENSPTSPILMRSLVTREHSSAASCTVSMSHH